MISSILTAISTVQRIRDPAEKEARLAELDRERESEGTAQLPDAVLYPILDCAGTNGPGCDDDEEDEEDEEEDLLFDEYRSFGSSRTGGAHNNERRRKRRKGDGSSLPVYDEDGRIRTGIPGFPLVMWVDIQGKWVEEKSFVVFQSKFGGLPARAGLEVTKMMYRTDASSAYSSSLSLSLVDSGNNSSNSNKVFIWGRYTLRAGASQASNAASDGNNQLPEEIFLPDPKIVQMHTRMKMFRPDEFTMEGIRRFVPIDSVE